MVKKKKKKKKHACGTHTEFTPLQADLNSDPQKYHSFSFYDRNKYEALADDNPKQYLESWIYEYQKMWKHNPYLCTSPYTFI